MVVGGGAWALHVAAIALAPLSVVQVVLSGGVVLIAVMADRLFGFEVGRRQWWGLGLTAVGLILLGVTMPHPHGAHSAFSLAAMIAFEARSARHRRPAHPRPARRRPRRAPRRHARRRLRHPLRRLRRRRQGAHRLVGHAASSASPARGCSSPLLASVAAFYASARSLQDGEAVAVIAITGTAANISCIAGGIIVFGDPMPGTALGIVVQAIAFVLVVIASALTPAPVRSAERAAPPPRPPRPNAASALPASEHAPRPSAGSSCEGHVAAAAAASAWRAPRQQAAAPRRPGAGSSSRSRVPHAIVTGAPRSSSPAREPVRAGAPPARRRRPGASRKASIGRPPHRLGRQAPRPPVDLRESSVDAAGGRARRGAGDRAAQRAAERARGAQRALRRTRSRARVQKPVGRERGGRCHRAAARQLESDGAAHRVARDVRAAEALLGEPAPRGAAVKPAGGGLDSPPCGETGEAGKVDRDDAGARARARPRTGSHTPRRLPMPCRSTSGGPSRGVRRRVAMWSAA